MENEKEFIDALNGYYSLKSQYEKTIAADKKKIINSAKSWREKRAQYRGQIKKCVNCKQSGGTLFTHLFVEEAESRVLTASCGHTADPCPLNIRIYLGNSIDLRDYNNNAEKEVEQLKNKIIMDKNDLIFGYITTENAVDKFDQNKEELYSAAENYQLSLGLTKDVLDNKELKREILDLKKDIYENDIVNIKGLVQQFNDSKDENTQFIRDAVDIYANSLTEKTGKLRQLEYPNTVVDYDSDDDTYHLIKIPYKLADLLEDYNSKTGIDIFQVGIGKKIKKKNATTAKNKVATTNKTKKVQLVLDDSSDEPQVPIVEESDELYDYRE